MDNGDSEECSMDGDVSSMPTTPRKKSRQRADVVVHYPSRRPGKNSNKRRDFIRGRFPRNGCKIVERSAQRGLTAQGVPRANLS